MNGKPSNENSPYDYIIVGSGAGGAPLAARLARAGKKVLVIEAGSNHTQNGPLDQANEITRVPLTHAASSEHPEIAWRFFVDHYQRNQNGQLPDGIPEDPKWHRPEDGEDESREGIFYPRAAGIGGCTIHNAMITVAGPESDWDDLASYLGDPSWNGRRMRAYFQRLERNEYHPAPDRSRRSVLRESWEAGKNSLRFLLGRRPQVDGGKHGFNGWLHTSLTDVSMGLEDRQLVKMLKAALWTSKWAGLDNAWSWVQTFFKGHFKRALDPNHYDTQSSSPEGIALIPLSVHGDQTTIHQDRSNPYSMRGRRSSPREFLLETLSLYPDRLTVWTDCLVTEVVLSDDPRPRAVGVKLLRGEKLYRAHVRPSDGKGEPDEVRVNPEGGEVILCGGTFNTPQLLMLSGIGPQDDQGQIVMTDSEEKKERRKRKRIKCRVPLSGVGRNMQDRYEVSIVSEMKKDFTLLRHATFRIPDDPQDADRHLQRWREEGTGLYTSNGGVLAILKRSRPELSKPDLFIFGVPSPFEGYKVGYSKIEQHNLFTWVVLKSHTRNRGGVVSLRSCDPRDPPAINFNYFNTASGISDSRSDPDLQAIIHGVRFVRKILGNAKKIVKSEVHPGTAVSADSAMSDWIRRDAWGHHACGTCRMGPDGDQGAVLDSRFRVRNVDGLRVVDASIFPNIPGYFIVTNIYMASEKAADVILEDAALGGGSDPPEYPLALRQLEADAIAQRRRVLNREGNHGRAMEPQPAGRTLESLEPNQIDGGPTSSVPEATEAAARELDQLASGETPLSADRQWREDVTGLALSGGGIRSATLSLGLLQSLAKARCLRRIDFLSTVSGGGYIGSCLGRFYDRMRAAKTEDQAALPNVPAADHVEQELTRANSQVLQWLRSHGNYIAPNGSGDGRTNFAIFVRNILSVHLIVGTLVFAFFCLANAIRFGLFDQLLAAWGLILDRGDMPIGGILEAISGPWFSPWFILFELLLLFLVLPRILAYWIVSGDKHESFKLVPLLVLYLAAGGLLYFGVTDGLQFAFVLLGLALFSALIQVEHAWRRGDLREAAVGTGGESSQRARTRNYLTYDLGLGLAIAGAFLGFALIDTLAQGIYEWKVEGNHTFAAAFASLAAAMIALTPVTRWLTEFFRSREASGANALIRFLKRDAFAGLLALVLLTVPLLFYCFAAHAIYQGGARIGYGLAATGVACLLTFFFAWPSAWGFVNRSSLSQVYAARLARAYLGASNPARHRPDGINITEVVPGDDVATIRDYRPHEASGPLHLINLTINQTIDYGSRLRKRDRQGTNMTVSCLGVTVGERWHNAWTNASRVGRPSNHSKRTGVVPLNRKPGLLHPFVDLLERPTYRAEMLSLRRWMAISGAAIDPGRGRNTRLGTSLLMGLVNLRTGHWWDTGLSESSRIGFPDASPIRRILYLIPRALNTQCLLLSEWLARFPGPWRRFWHLSDGGFFENLGAYELVRRRVPRMIVCDGGADPEYDLSDFSELVRKVRIDFNARVESLSEKELDELGLPEQVRSRLGTVDQLRPQTSGTAGPTPFSQIHAALCWVHYPAVSQTHSVSEVVEVEATPEGEDHADAASGGAELPRRSLILYVKATVTGDEPQDIRNYHQSHPQFPHESTGDQFFDEAQWESYRKLGEHAGSQLFVDDWFWKVELAASKAGAP